MPPTIQIEPGVFTESQLILRFLSDEYGGAKLWGNAADDADRRRDDFLQVFAVNTLLPKMDLLVMLESIVAVLPMGISVLVRLVLSPLLSFSRGQLQPVFQVLEDLLGEGEGRRPWFAGARFGLADFNVCWGVDMATQRGYLDAAAFPRLVDWHARAQARSGYQLALKKCNGYDLKTFGI
jgi:glutathione S-transferase